MVTQLHNIQHNTRPPFFNPYRSYPECGTAGEPKWYFVVVRCHGFIMFYKNPFVRFEVIMADSMDYT